MLCLGIRSSGGSGRWPPTTLQRRMEGWHAEETTFWHGGVGTQEGLPARGSSDSRVRCSHRRPGERKGKLERIGANRSFVTVRYALTDAIDIQTE